MSSHEWILRASSTAKLRTAICAAALSAAVVLGAGASTSLADDRGGRSSNGAHAIALPADLRPVLDLYRDGGSGLGVPALIVRGTTPERTIAVDDVDGDGHADLVVTDSRTGKSWALRGDGTRRFDAAVPIEATGRQRVVAIGDFNGDGHNDQAVADRYAGGIALLYGDGHGRFKPAAGTFDAFDIAVVADFDNDGHADVAIVDRHSGQLTIFRGDGQGGVASRSNVDVGFDSTILAIGDFDGDGITDLVVGSSRSETIAIVLGDGAGGIKAVKSVALGLQPRAIAVGDFKGDGILDLAAVGSTFDGIALLAGDGHAGFSPPVMIAVDDSSPAQARAQSSARSVVAGYVGFPVVSLTLNAATVAGGSGGTSTGTVTLGGPAPAGGTPIDLTSSNTDLAASVPGVVVAEGATSATFTVGTNASYRRYSGLAFNATVTAKNPGDGTSASAILTVTAQPRPGTFPSDSSQRSGLMCGGTFPASQGERGILFSCSLAPNRGTTGTCTVRQECTLGCQTQPPSGFTGFRDICATSAPFPVSLSPRAVVGGNPSNGTVSLRTPSQPAPLDASALVVSNSLSATVTPSGVFSIPTGAASAGFAVSTAPVAVPNFAAIGANVTTPQPLARGAIFDSNRIGLAWLAVVPAAGASPPAVMSLTLNPSTVAGGTPSLATVTLTQPAPAGGVDVRITTDRSDVSGVPFTVNVPQGQAAATFTVTTSAVTANTPATIGAAFGGVTKTAVLTVTGGPPPIAVSSLFFTPSSVVGGVSSQGRVTLTSAVTSNTTVALSADNPAVVTVPATVTVPAGNFAVNFTATTRSVAATTTVTVSGTLGGSTQQGTLTVTP